MSVSVLQTSPRVGAPRNSTFTNDTTIHQVDKVLVDLAASKHDPLLCEQLFSGPVGVRRVHEVRVVHMGVQRLLYEHARIRQRRVGDHGVANEDVGDAAGPQIARDAARASTDSLTVWGYLVGSEHVNTLIRVIVTDAVCGGSDLEAVVGGREAPPRVSCL